MNFQMIISRLIVIITVIDNFIVSCSQPNLRANTAIEIETRSLSTARPVEQVTEIRANALFVKINRERRLKNITALTHSLYATRLAIRWSQKMVTSGFDAPDEQSNHGHVQSNSGCHDDVKIIHDTERNLNKVFMHWMENADESFLNSKYHYIGIGAVRKGKSVYVTQMLCSSKPVKEVKQISVMTVNIQQKILAIENEERIKNGKIPLQIRTTLEQDARRGALEMKKDSEPNLVSYINDCEQNFAFLSAKHISAESIVKDWLAAYDYIISEKYQYTGIGVKALNTGWIYAVQYFCGISNPTEKGKSSYKVTAKVTEYPRGIPPKTHSTAYRKPKVIPPRTRRRKQVHDNG
mmetsp:Transcript_42440/g.83387  ORF Transcript_42440/g.83387 Transcript_42440/m.83387 type:complete len:351 (+) Transcript_42440:144-1196(+)